MSGSTVVLNMILLHFISIGNITVPTRQVLLYYVKMLNIVEC